MADVIAEVLLLLSGWQQEILTNWTVTNVNHSIGSDGWNMDVEAESLL